MKRDVTGFLTPLREAAARGDLAQLRSDVLADLVTCRSHLDVLRLGVRLGLEALPADSIDDDAIDTVINRPLRSVPQPS